MVHWLAVTYSVPSASVSPLTAARKGHPAPTAADHRGAPLSRSNARTDAGGSAPGAVAWTAVPTYTVVPSCTGAVVLALAASAARHRTAPVAASSAVSVRVATSTWRPSLTTSCGTPPSPAASHPRAPVATSYAVTPSASARYARAASAPTCAAALVRPVAARHRTASVATGSAASGRPGVGAGGVAAATGSPPPRQAARSAATTAAPARRCPPQNPLRSKRKSRASSCRAATYVRGLPVSPT